MSCQFITTPTSIQITPSNQVQPAQKTSTLSPTMIHSQTNEIIPSQIPPTATTVAVSDLTNTHWVGSIYDENNPMIWEVFEIVFLPDGKMRYYIPNAWHENGTWQQKGDDFILEWGDHACDFYGVLYGDTIAGARKCSDGKTKGWSVQLKTP
jgi:hypothetical protein